MSLKGRDKKVKTLESLGFTVSVVDYKGTILDNKELDLEAYVSRSRDFIEFRKYYFLENRQRFVSKNSVPLEFLIDCNDPFEFIKRNMERTYQNYLNNLNKTENENSNT